MALTFKKALLKALQATGKSVAEVARGAGVSKDQLHKVLQRDNATTNVDDARRVAVYFGRTLDQFLEDKEYTDLDDTVADLMKLTPQERRFLRNSAKGQLAERFQQEDEK